MQTGDQAELCGETLYLKGEEKKKSLPIMNIFLQVQSDLPV